MAKISETKKIVFVMLIISIFVLAVALSSLYVQINLETGNICGCAIPISLFIPLLSSIGLFIGTLVYYLLSPRFEVQKIDKKVLFSLFSDEEKKILEEVIKHKKGITQAKLVKDTKFRKVKVFRVLEKLKSRGVIKKIPYGKTNLITLTDNWKKIANTIKY